MKLHGSWECLDVQSFGQQEGLSADGVLVTACEMGYMALLSSGREVGRLFLVSVMRFLKHKRHGGFPCRPPQWIVFLTKCLN